MPSRIRSAFLSLTVLSGMAGARQSVAEMQLTDAAGACATARAVALLDQGVNINTRNSGGYTALMMAATYGCEDLARLLIARGADRSVKTSAGWDAAHLARINGYRNITAMLEAASTPAKVNSPASRQTPGTVPTAPKQPDAPAPVSAAAGSRTWPRLGHYRVGQTVLYSATAGKTWERGVVRSIDPRYGYNIAGVTGSEDAYFVVGTGREPFWTGWFVGDWRVSVPVALNTVTDGRDVYRVVSGGLRLPPLRIGVDGRYSWRVPTARGETLIQGRWIPNPDGPGVILKNAEGGADWRVYNNSRTGSALGETIILSSNCCTPYDGTRLK